MSPSPHRRLRRLFRAALPLLLACALVSVPASAGAPVPGNGPGGLVLLEGEELVYNVRNAFINLGQVRITTVGRTTADGRECYFTRALIDSYRGVPFVDLHAVFESTIDPLMHSRRFMGKIKQDATWDFSRYRFDYDRNQVMIEMGERDTVVAKRETLEVRSTFQDGLSLFFLARDSVMSRKEINVPTLIKEKKGNTFLSFTGGRTSVEVDAIDYPVDVQEFDGNLDFIGIFGLTGDFEGWFSNDSARVPIKAKMEVIIGSVTIELISWKRPGWIPPRGED